MSRVPQPGEEVLSINQPEHYLDILERLNIAHWMALALVLLLSAMLRMAMPDAWPDDGHFDLLFGMVAAEYGGVSAMLALALKFRGWYQHTPRLAVNRLHHLTMLVLTWDAVHVFGALLVFGGLAGPFAVLLPVLLLLGGVILPRRQAVGIAAGVVVLLVLILVLQLRGVLYWQGMLGPALLNDLPQTLPLYLLVLLGVSIPALWTGISLRKGLEADSRGMHPVDLIDGRFGCFTMPAFQRRMSEELARGRRHKSPASLLIVQLQDLPSILARDGLNGVDRALQWVADEVQAHTRIELDTCCYLGSAAFGLLLPTANGDAAAEVQRRLKEALLGHMPWVKLRFSLSTRSHDGAGGDEGGAAEWLRDALHDLKL